MSPCRDEPGRIEKGIDHMWKTYEIADVSHGDATSEADDYPELAKDMVDIGGVAIALEQALVAWVREGKEPPESRVDARDVWEADPNVGPAIKLPETACPRGVFRTYMNRPDGTAAVARYGKPRVLHARCPHPLAPPPLEPDRLSHRGHRP